MKLNPLVTANALAATSVIFYVACRILVGLLPNLMFTVAQSWMHDIALTQLTRVPSAQSLVLGVLSLAATAWLSGYLYAGIYNALVKK